MEWWIIFSDDNIEWYTAVELIRKLARTRADQATQIIKLTKWAHDTLYCLLLSSSDSVKETRLSSFYFLLNVYLQFSFLLIILVLGVIIYFFGLVYFIDGWIDR